eukprot:Gb_00673 [translate_table: standard]
MGLIISRLGEVLHCLCCKEDTPYDLARLKTDFEMGNVIRVGRFGVVRRFLCRKTRKVYACKIMRKIKEAIKEISILKQLAGHPSILKLKECEYIGYSAPEVLGKIGHSKEADIWSAGVVLYLVLCGELPFQGEDRVDLYNRVMTGRLADLHNENWKKVSNQAKDLVHGMLDCNVRTQLTSSQVLMPLVKKSRASLLSRTESESSWLVRNLQAMLEHGSLISSRRAFEP